MHPSEAIRASEGEELLGKTVVLAVTGSIAAVETVKLARELIRHGADVVAVMSRAAQDLIHPNALQFATGNPVVTGLDGSVSYLDYCGKGGRAALLLVAPATANTIAKMAAAIDDTPVTTFITTALGSGLPLLVAPAMDGVMYRHPILQEHMAKLQALGVEFVEPLLEEEKAKLAEVETVVARVIRRLGPRDLAGKRVLVVAGGTEEPLDEVRVLTNLSTGETGVELARAAFLRGADVDLWLGRASAAVPPYLRTWRFATTEELLARVQDLSYDVVAVPAAISDYVPERTEGKIPSGQEDLVVRLWPNDRVIEAFRKDHEGTLIGFKLEAGVDEEELIRRARQRQKAWGAEFVVANDVRAVKPGTTEVLLLGPKGKARPLQGSKQQVAWDLWGAVLHGG